MTVPYLVSVVVPTYQRCASVERLLVALARQTMSPEQFEVIISIDGSEDGTREMVTTFSAPFALKMLWQSNQGRAAACNAGINAARGELLVILDDDMEPGPHFLQAHHEAHPAGSRRGVMGAVPISFDHTSPLVVQFIGKKFNNHLERLAEPGHQLKLRDFYSGNFSIAREVMREVGGYDEAFKIYGNEDLELSLRLSKAGVQLRYSPAALARQHYTKNFVGLARDNIAKGRTAVLLATKHAGAFYDLKLSSYKQGSRKWRLLREGLLGLSRIWPKTSEVVMGFMQWLEKRRPARMELYYSLALDYFYWLGAKAALRENGPVEGSFATAVNSAGTMPQTVFHFTDSKGFGGAEQAILNLMTGLDRQRWQPVLVHHAEPGLNQLVESARQAGIATWAIPRMDEGWAGARRSLWFAWQLRQRRPAVFHAHLTWPRACKFGLVAAVLARVPAILATEQLFVELPVTRSIYWQQRLLAFGIGRYIAVSEEVSRKLRQYFEIPARKITVIPNSICLARFNHPANPTRRAALFGPTEGPVVLTLARLDKQKGHAYLLEAARQIPEALFVLAGDGPERANLEALVGRLEIEERVVFLGHRQDTLDLLVNCDLFVLPSLYEGLPISVLEAMAVGKPVIATKIGGTDEAVISGETGLLVSPADPSALAEAIRTLLGDQELSRRLAQAGQARVYQEFSAEMMISRVCQLYEELLEQRRGGKR